MISQADEWYIHQEALQVYFNHDGILSGQPRYNSRLNSHERIAELAESFTAELVVARYFGLDYDVTINKAKRQADVGVGLEVKWTSYDQGHLIVYPNDRDGDVAILVTGKSPHYRIAGLIPVGMAKVKRYARVGQDSWWITQDNLNPIENLLGSQYGNLVRAVSSL